MPFKPCFIFIMLIAAACSDNARTAPGRTPAVEKKGTDNPYAHIGDIPLPAGFTRVTDQPDSFAAFLRNIELKKDRTVYKYDGYPKTNQSAQFAVLNISVGHQDLQQCADAVMRLRAEYLFAAKKFGQILFRDNNGTAYQFTSPWTRDHFNNYLLRVFGMCGSASLSKSLSPVDLSGIRPGDVLIRGGFPGHAVMVMDVAVNAAGEKVFLLAQSYMPAQDIHVLVNPGSAKLSPWYAVNDNTQIPTPEYLFYRNELKRW